MVYPLPIDIVTKIDLKHSLIIQRVDGIIELRCSNDFVYDVEHVAENQSTLQRMADGKKLLVINFTEEYTSISSEARSFLAKGKHEDFIAAEAFLIHSLPHKLLAQFYVRVNKPKVPTQYFAYHEKEKAEKWLQKFRINELEKA